MKMFLLENLLSVPSYQLSKIDLDLLKKLYLNYLTWNLKSRRSTCVSVGTSTLFRPVTC